MVIVEKEHQSDGRQIGQAHFAPVRDESSQGRDLFRTELPGRHRELHRFAPPFLIGSLFSAGKERVRPPLFRRRDDRPTREPHAGDEGNKQGRDYDESQGNFSG